MTQTVGQTVYLAKTNRSTRNTTIEEGVLKAIGRKYYTVTVHYCDYRFHRENLEHKSMYAPEYKLFFTMQDFQDEHERQALSEIIREVIGKYGTADLTLGQLRRIKSIIDEEVEATQA
jgi:hypothetical protein